MAIQGWKDMWRPIANAYLPQLRDPKQRRRARKELYGWVEKMGVTGPEQENRHIQKVKQIMTTKRAIQRVENEGKAVWCDAFPPGTQQRVCHLDPETHRVKPEKDGYANEEQTKMPPINVGRMVAEATKELGQWRDRTCAPLIYHTHNAAHRQTILN
jgi:hypothetical protein